MSRFGWGSSDMAWYSAAWASSGSRISVALTKSCQYVLKIRGSLSERRKSLTVPHNTWTSTFDKLGAPLPLRKLSCHVIKSWDMLTTQSRQKLPSLQFFFFKKKRKTSYFECSDISFWAWYPVYSHFSKTPTFYFPDTVNNQRGNHGTWHRSVVSNSPLKEQRNIFYKTNKTRKWMDNGKLS